MANIKTAEEKGRKLGTLIVSLKITDQEREAMLGLLPHMTEIQIDNLITALEINYLQVMTQDQDSRLAQDLKKAEEDFEAKILKINAGTNQALESII